MKKLIAHYKKINRPDVVSALTRIRDNEEAEYSPCHPLYSLRQTLNKTFLWGATTEGYDFWNNLSTDLVEVGNSEQT